MENVWCVSFHHSKEIAHSFHLIFKNISFFFSFAKLFFLFLFLIFLFISHMIFYMFQCHSPISSRLRPLPRSPRVFNISVSLLLSRIQGYCYLLSKFHIYALVLVFFFLAYFTLYNRLQFHPPH